MPLGRVFWEKRADKLFNEWDAIDDPYGLPTAEFYKANKKINEAIIISMMLESADKGLLVKGGEPWQE